MTFMPSRLDLPAYLLLLTGLLHLVGFAYIIRRPRNPINRSYAALSLALFAWSVGLAMNRIGDVERLSTFLWSMETYLMGFLASVCFAIFAYLYPYRLREYSAALRIAFMAIAAFGVMIVVTNLLDIEMTVINGYNADLVDLGWFTVYGILTLGYLLVGLFQLYQKYKSADGNYQYRIGAVLLTSSIATAVAVIFNIILPYYFRDFAYYWLGPFFTLSLFSVVTYLVYGGNVKAVQ